MKSKPKYSLKLATLMIVFALGAAFSYGKFFAGAPHPGALAQDDSGVSNMCTVSVTQCSVDTENSPSSEKSKHCQTHCSHGQTAELPILNLGPIIPSTRVADNVPAKMPMSAELNRDSPPPNP